MIAACIVVDVWKTTPFMALLLLAGLQTIPRRRLRGCPKVDGANVMQRFFRITLPLLKPAILVALLFRTLDAWRIYDLFWVLSDRNLESLEHVRIQDGQGQPVAVRPGATRRRC